MPNDPHPNVHQPQTALANLTVKGGRWEMNTPTISVPVDTLLNLAVLSKTSGENSKGQMAEIIKGILDENLKEMEKEIVVR